MSGLSSLAQQAKRLRVGTVRSAPIFGLAVHTTGSGIVDQARKLGRPPLEHAAAYYANPANFFPHHVMGWDGTILQVADEEIRAQHIGFAERDTYLSGAWEHELPPELVALWRAAWPTFKTPAHLFPGSSPNNVYVGLELLPLEDTPETPPAFAGARYTLAQHQGVVMLAGDIGDRHELPTGWAASSRLVGHEDVNPITRSTKHPPAGWDPGALRPAPWFDFGWVRRMLAGGSSSPPGPGSLS